MAPSSLEGQRESLVFAYIPVLHQGYLNFLQEHARGKTLLLPSKALLRQFRPLQKDIRAVAPELMQKSIAALGIVAEVQVVDEKALQELATSQAQTVVYPDDEHTRQLVQTYFLRQNHQPISVFLRWDSQKSTTEHPVNPSETISSDSFAKKMMLKAADLSQRSADWWRQVGCVVVKDGVPILSFYNRHVPGEQQSYYVGDPRADFSKGVHIELSTALHAEAAAIAEAARQGIALEGTELYVTTFPCPVCAKSIAYAGIKRIFYAEGYAMLDGESILKDRGVEIVRVD